MRLPTTPAITLLRQLRDEARQHYRRGRVVIAVDGIDGAGKTVFADALAEVFAEDGSAVFRASIDDFHRPRAERYANGRHSPEGFYRDSFDYSTFRRVLIDPFREGGQTGASTGFQLAAFDVVRDTAVESAWTTAPKDAV
ncbi:MAG: uridine kinase, partial [Microbacterium sp.]